MRVEGYFLLDEDGTTLTVVRSLVAVVLVVVLVVDGATVSVCVAAVVIAGPGTVLVTTGPGRSVPPCPNRSVGGGLRVIRWGVTMNTSLRPPTPGRTTSP